MVKMELIGQPGNVELRDTVTREGALGAAVSYMLERGYRLLAVAFGPDLQSFTVQAAQVTPFEPDDPKPHSVDWRPRSTTSKTKGRPPASGWTKVKNFLKFPPLVLPEKYKANKHQMCFYVVVCTAQDNQVVLCKQLPDPHHMMLKDKVFGMVLDYIAKHPMLNEALQDTTITDDLAVYLCQGKGGEEMTAKLKRYS